MEVKCSTETLVPTYQNTTHYVYLHLWRWSQYAPPKLSRRQSRAWLVEKRKVAAPAGKRTLVIVPVDWSLIIVIIIILLFKHLVRFVWPGWTKIPQSLWLPTIFHFQFLAIPHPRPAPLTTVNHPVRGSPRDLSYSNFNDSALIIIFFVSILSTWPHHCNSFFSGSIKRFWIPTPFLKKINLFLNLWVSIFSSVLLREFIALFIACIYLCFSS